MAQAKNTQSSSTPKIGVTFGGGGAKGFAHIHAIKAFDELGIKPAQITGASMGSIMGAGMAAGMPGADIEEHAQKAFGEGTEVIARLWRMRPKTLSDAFGKHRRFGQLHGKRLLRSFLPSDLPEKIEDLNIPFSAIAADFYGMTETVLSEGDLFTALAASSAIPGVFEPVSIDGRFHIDAGVVNCLPFDHLSEDLDLTIAIDVAGEPVDDNKGRPPSSIDALSGTNLIMMRQMRILRLRQRQPDILVQAPVNAFGVQDFLKVKTIIEVTSDLNNSMAKEMDRLINAKLKGETPKPIMLLVEPRALS